MRAVVTVIGKDCVGILAKISAVCAQNHANVVEVSQSVMQDLFAMVMLVDISNLCDTFDHFSSRLESEGEKAGLHVRIMHEDLVNAMHNI